MAEAPVSTIGTGLEGVELCNTCIADVDGKAGHLTIQGYDIRELAGKVTFEEEAYLLWHGKLPNSSEYRQLKSEMAEANKLPPATLSLLEQVSKTASGMHALRMAASTLSEGDADVDDISIEASRRRASRLLARMPLIVATYWRLRNGQSVIEARPEAGVAESFLHTVHGKVPDPAQVEALDAYLVAVSEHGMNASTFTGRVVISTDADMVSALTAAICALKGPKHGGVPGPVLDMMEKIGTPANAEAWIREHLKAGRKVMGFGHRVYKVRDPRAEVLSVASLKLIEKGSGDRHLFDLTHAVEDTTVKVLAEVKPGRELFANVELYAALILHTIGIPSEIFTPVFGIGRTAGWTAHMVEQLQDNRIIRPSSVYAGPKGLKWKPIGERE
ncbi:MAG: citrate/2-methylcitrate synthase [Armatimonadota bacterium]|nr:citrate/2-methylcitrate synthase [Armatimonadota bacterium]